MLILMWEKSQSLRMSSNFMNGLQAQPGNFLGCDKYGDKNLKWGIWVGDRSLNQPNLFATAKTKHRQTNTNNLHLANTLTKTKTESVHLILSLLET